MNTPAIKSSGSPILIKPTSTNIARTPGIRVTIFSGEITKPGVDTVVFRKYLLSDYSFECLASYGTFPYEAIPLFEAMVKIGFNVVFAEQMRSGKTTFLQTWQVPEDKSRKRLKGVVEYRYDALSNKVSVHRICKYDAKSDTWKWKYDIGPDKQDLVISDIKAFEEFQNTLKSLSEANPLEEETVIYPAYYKGNRMA